MDNENLGRPQLTGGPPPENSLTQEELNKTLDLHEAWLSGSEGGIQANLNNKRLMDLNFSGRRLSKATFTNACLSKSNFQGAELIEADLTKAKLFHANLTKANLEKALMLGCQFENADLTGANLQDAQLNNAHLGNATLKNTNLSGANLENSVIEQREFKGFNFSKANLKLVNFNNADLSEADFSNATLHETQFNSANLTKAVFTGADLTNAILQNANLTEAILIEANLEEAQLHSANLNNAKLQKANLKTTKLYFATLTNANLNGVTAQDANFQGADLEDAKLINADLTSANLDEGAKDGKSIKTKLINVNLTGAIISHAQFSNADLTNADLTNTTAHRAQLSNAITARTKFNGADLTNAQMADKFFDDRIKTIEDATRITRIQFLTLLGALAFSGLTIASTEDILLITNSETFQLPIFQSPIPIVMFYFTAPILLVGLFIYFHLYLKHLYQRISELPARFDDGMAVDEKIFPWMLNLCVRDFFSLHKKKPLSSAQKNLVVFLAWWTTPITLLFFWLRYLSAHGPWGTILHGLILFIAFYLAKHFYRIDKQILSFKEPEEWHALNLYTELKKMGIISVFLIFSLSLGTFYADLSFLPRKLSFVGLNIPLRDIFTADFDYQDVSTKKDKWDPSNPTQLIKGADLNYANMNHANGMKAFLINARMVNAQLKSANFHGSKLQGANLSDANLEKADFTNADLSNANLMNANLKNAKFEGADLSLAFLIVEDGDLKKSEIEKAINWRDALYTDKFRNHLGISDEEICKLLPLFIKREFPALKDTPFENKVKIYLNKLYGSVKCKGIVVSQESTDSPMSAGSR